MNKLSTLSAALALTLLSGCANEMVVVSTPTPQAPILPSPVIQLSERATPTTGSTATTKAHYEHVFLDGNAKDRRSLKSIELNDAINNDVLINSDLQTQTLDSKRLRSRVNAGSTWVVMDKVYPKPTRKEAVGGEGIDAGMDAEVYFDLNETLMKNPERLTAMVERSRLIAGEFYVVGYTDATGGEKQNEKLSQERAKAVSDALIEAGINKTRVQSKGLGVSSKHPSHELNRRAIVVFVAED
jgi:outer membrane protein OmpA-like peptidoglycan-associated protein